MYLCTEDVARIAWRGRWAQTKTLEHYIQEVGAQLFLHQLPEHVKYRLSFLEKHCFWLVCKIFLQAKHLAEQYGMDGRSNLI